jgi:branched-chain amino acid transport system ATP-binding protein
MLKVKELTVGYSKDIHILKELNLEAKERKITVVLGANGVGKSTLLKTVFGFLAPYEGTIAFKGQDITGTAPFELASMGISYIPQKPNIFPHMTIAENLQLGAWTFRHNKDQVNKRILENFERFPILSERKQAKAKNLSGGQQRMLELGRALMTSPSLLLIDEPTAGLAPKVAKLIYHEIVRLKNEEDRTIILVDQNIKQAIAIADYVYIIELGQNSIEGPREKFDDIRQMIKSWF